MPYAIGEEHQEGDEASSILYDLEHGTFVDSQYCCRVASPDSQLTTQDEEVQDIPDVNDIPYAPALDTFFDDGVDEILDYCTGKPWFDSSFFWHAPREFAANADAAIAFIIRNCIMHQFKIGITERPDLRWPLYKKSTDHIKWTTMFLLYAAPISKSAMCSSDSPSLQALKKTSTGAMEKHLIRFFNNFDGCVNDAPGGERPSDGSPHFTYVVIGDEDATCKRSKRRKYLT
jgi:hypothetical protein